MDPVVFMIFLKALSLHFNAAGLSLTSLAVEPPAMPLGNAASPSEEGGQYGPSGHLAISPQSGDPQAQATWRFDWNINIMDIIRGTIGVTVTYRVNVDVNVENLNKWLPASNSTLEVRYTASGGVLSYTISWNGLDIYSGDIQVKPGEQMGPVDIDLASILLLSLAKLRIYGLINVSADTTAQGATPQTFGGYVPTSTTIVPSSNVQLATTFYISPMIRLQLDTPLGSPQKDFSLQRVQGAQVSLRINRVILHSNCGTWVNLTTGNPPYRPPRVLTPNETTVCVLSRVLGENRTAAGYEIYAEYINPTITTSRQQSSTTEQPSSTSEHTHPTSSWQPSSLVVLPPGTGLAETQTFRTGTQTSQIGVWQIVLWAVVGVAVFLAVYLVTDFLFNKRGRLHRFLRSSNKI
jgi:hypothetical protein